MYWVADAQGRVLGPMQFETVVELVASGRFPELARVSRDGQTWVDTERVPEVAGLLRPQVQLSESEKAQKVRDYLKRIQTLSVHEVFRVPITATVSDFRAAFFSTVKRFYPDQHPPGELKAACESVFLHLAGLMVAIDRGAIPATTPRPPPAFHTSRPSLTLVPPAPTTPRPPSASGTIIPPHDGTPRPPSASQTPRPPSMSASLPSQTPRPPVRLPGMRDAPTYEPAEFLGLRWNDQMVEARIRMLRKHIPMFTGHPLANFKTQSVFIPGSQIIPLGTLMDLTFEFEEPSAQVQVRGKVFWENSGMDPRQASGFGVRFFTLKPAEIALIEAFIRNA
ncbi:MAG: hypothetical protein ACT4TC_12240 [Myxococcaceae bacterium]